MGWPPPDTSNQCDSNLNREYDLPNFCAPAGPAGDGNRKKYCELMGKDEWRFKVSSPSCKYSWCDSVTRTTGGCMNGCCSIVGRGAYCQRIAFTANSADCCFLDYTFSGIGCIINPTPTQNSRTCDPQLRDITSDNFPLDRVSNGSSSCRTLVDGICSDVTSPTFVQDWQIGGKCIYAIDRNLFGNAAGTVSVLSNTPISPDYYVDARGIDWARNLVSKVVEELAARGLRIPSTIGDVTYTPFQESFMLMSVSAPGIITDALKFTVCAGYTAETISYNTTLTQLCGCYLSEDQYSRYTDVYGVNKECTPTCTIPGGVRLVNEDGYTTRTCDQDVCVIDNININLGNNNSDTDFSQICGGCGPDASCRCFISGLTIDAANGLIGNIDISQGCGSETICTDSFDRPIDCTTGELLDDEPLDDGGDESPLRWKDNPWAPVVWTVMFIILMLVILLIAVNNRSEAGDIEDGEGSNAIWMVLGIAIIIGLIVFILSIGGDNE